MYKIGIEKERYRTESCTAVWKKQGQKDFVPQLQNSGTRKKHRKADANPVPYACTDCTLRTVQDTFCILTVRVTCTDGI